MASADVETPVKLDETKTTKPSKTRKAAEKKASNSDGKKKREPTAWDIYLAEQSKKLKAADPTIKQKDIFAKVGAMWKDAPENPNKGAPSKKRAKKDDGASKDAKKKKAEAKEGSNGASKEEQEEEEEEEKQEHEKQEE